MAADERQRLNVNDEEDQNFEFPDDDAVDEEEVEDGEESTPGDDEGETPTQPEPFKLSGDESSTPGDKAQGGEDEKLFKIIHRGQVHYVTEDKARELAQKGYDYDVKVGPHARLAKLVESDPQLAQEIDQAIRRRMNPAGQNMTGQQPQNGIEDPFSGMEDDEPLTAAEARKALQRQQEMFSQQIQTLPQQFQQHQQAQQQQNSSNQVQMMLQSRDPEHFRQVVPKLQEYAQSLSMKDYQRVNSDPAALCQFYDYVKAQVTKPNSAQSPPGPGSFRAKSGGGNPPRTPNPEKKIWEMPNADFERELAKIKGYA